MLLVACRDAFITMCVLLLRQNQELSTKNFNLINDLQGKQCREFTCSLPMSSYLFARLRCFFLLCSDRNQRVSELEEEKSALRQQAEELAQQVRGGVAVDIPFWLHCSC
jgi:hypothetical protein